MCEPIALDDYRAQNTPRKTREALTSQLPSPVRCGDWVRVYETGREHRVWWITKSGKPVVYASGVSQVLSPGQYERLGK